MGAFHGLQDCRIFQMFPFMSHCCSPLLARGKEAGGNCRHPLPYQTALVIAKTTPHRFSAQQ